MSPTRLLLTANRLVLLGLLVVILARPTWGQVEGEVQVSDAEVLVVVDRTRSMAALDGEGEDGEQARIIGARRDVVGLTEALPGSRFSLITFGTAARVELPFTSDALSFQSALDSMRLEEDFAGTGSRMDVPLEDMRETLERAAEQHPDRKRFVVFVSDGENTDVQGEQESFADLADLLAGGAVLGYGTEDGARMPTEGESDEGDYVFDYESADDAVSKLDTENLEGIAEEMGVEYVHRTGAGGLDELTSGWESALLDGEDESSRARDITWLFGLLALPFALIELGAGWRAALRSRGVLR